MREETRALVIAASASALALFCGLLLRRFFGAGDTYEGMFESEDEEVFTSEGLSCP